MDGYALGSLGEKSYSVIGESPAGSIFPSTVKKGESVRIFTGSAIPDGCVAVVMQERVNRQENTIVVEGEVDKGANIRPAGEQLAKGQGCPPRGWVFCYGQQSVALTPPHAIEAYRLRRHRLGQ